MNGGTMKRVVLLVGLLSTFSATAQVASQKTVVPHPSSAYWSESWRGWHFYEEPEPETEEKLSPQLSVPPSVTPAKPEPQKAPELVQFERLQKRLEEYRNIAIINPTEANVRRYMELESRVVS